MQMLTDVGDNLVRAISSRYNLSYDAVVHMLIAVNNGGGTMAQFNCPELGGSGQWMRGGMTMVGDMFNYGLQSTVDNLCNELSNVLANNQVFPVIPPGTPGSNQWWPVELGAPFSSGGQNNVRYAIFPNRLAVELNGAVSIYDTLNHNIGGVSQQQGGDSSLTFSSQFGNVSVNELPLISGPGTGYQPQTNFASPVSNDAVSVVPNNGNQLGSDIPTTAYASESDSSNSTDVIELLEKLGKLKDAGVLTEQEFDSKKQQLLNRI